MRVQRAVAARLKAAIKTLLVEANGQGLLSQKAVDRIFRRWPSLRSA
jgi:hypothetical protein